MPPKFALAPPAPRQLVFGHKLRFLRDSMSFFLEGNGSIFDFGRHEVVIGENISIHKESTV